LINVIPVIAQGSNILMMHQRIYSTIGKNEAMRNGPGKLSEKLAALLGNGLSGRSKVSYTEVGCPHVLGQRLQLVSKVYLTPIFDS
jgi:hypothetical protein